MSENTILDVASATGGERSAARRWAERTLSDRLARYEAETQRLVDAGIAVLERSGDLDARVSDIVAEAGLSNRAFYRHFSSRDELLAAILEFGLGELVRYARERMGRAACGLDAVDAWVEAILAQAQHDRAAAATRPFAIDGARLGVLFPELTARSTALLQEPLREALERSRDEGTASSADPERDTAIVYHLAVGLMQAHLVAGTRPSANEVAHAVAFVRRALGA